MKNKKSIVVLNKIDLGKSEIEKQEIEQIITNPQIIEISAKNNIGIEKIYDLISKMFEINEISLDNSTIITNIRHKNIIKKAFENTIKAIEATKGNIPTDIIRIIYKRNFRRFRQNYRRKCIR